MKLYVLGRSLFAGYPAPLAYIGAVSANPNKSNRADDIVQTLPTRNPSAALLAARELRDILYAQSDGRFLP